MSATVHSIPGAGHRWGRVAFAVATLFVFVVVAGLTSTGSVHAEPTQPAPPVSSSTVPAAPTAPDTPPSEKPPSPGQQAPDESACGITNIPACVSNAIESFFRDLVTPGLNSLLALLATSLLVTPRLDQLPVMGEIWGNSQQIVIASYAILIMIAAITVMAHQTLQTRHSIKEILPRVIIGFLAANLSLFFGGQIIALGNALSRAVLGARFNPEDVAEVMTDAVMRDLDTGGAFVIFIALAFLVMLVAVLLTFIVRITLAIMLLAGAPLFLMCHALPHTEGIAFWWWKAFAGVMAIQIAQSLALVATLKLFFLPGGVTLFN